MSKGPFMCLKVPLREFKQEGGTVQFAASVLEINDAVVILLKTKIKINVICRRCAKL